jgi:hypothetical protein
MGGKTAHLGHGEIEALILRAFARKLVVKGVLSPDDVRALLLDATKGLDLVGSNLTPEALAALSRRIWRLRSWGADQLSQRLGDNRKTRRVCASLAREPLVNTVPMISAFAWPIFSRTKASANRRCARRLLFPRRERHGSLRCQQPEGESLLTVVSGEELARAIWPHSFNGGRLRRQRGSGLSS